MSTTTLTVTGMTCGHCERSVKSALEALEGVGEVGIDLATGEVRVGGDGVELAAMTAAIEDAGYTVAP